MTRPPSDTLPYDHFDQVEDAIAVYTAALQPFAARIVYANDALCTLSGYAKAHFVGHSAVLLAGASPDMSGLASITPSAGSDHLRTSVRKVRADGTPYEVTVHVDPVRDTEGRVTHYIARQVRIASMRVMVAPTRRDRSLPLVLDPSFATSVFARASSYAPRRPRGTYGRDGYVVRLVASRVRPRVVV